MIHIEKWIPKRPVTAVYFDAEKELHYVKRFYCEVTTDKKVLFISEFEGSYLDVVATAYRPEVRIVYNKLLRETKNLPDNVVNLADLIDVKGMKAQGNQLTKLKVKEIILTHEIDGGEPWPEDIITDSTTVDPDATMEWDIIKPSDKDGGGNPTLFDDTEEE